MSEVQQDNRIDRTYAHFHRVLGELLTELSALPGTLWLSDKEHVIRSFKIWRILKETYRNRRRRFALRFNLIAGLINAHLEL